MKENQRDSIRDCIRFLSFLHKEAPARSLDRAMLKECRVQLKERLRYLDKMAKRAKASRA